MAISPGGFVTFYSYIVVVMALKLSCPPVL